MALEEERAIDWLRECADLSGVDPPTLEALAAGAVHFSLPAGFLLFEAGSEPLGVYLLGSGRLGVKTGSRAGLTAEIEHGELVGEAGWLLRTQRSATVVALRDSELLLIPNDELDRIAARSTHFSLALARLCARRLRISNTQAYKPKRAHIFTLVPNSIEVDVADLATCLVDELSKFGRTELVWDARATTHTSSWFNRIEEFNDFVVYVANWSASGWTQQCCRQADVILMAAPAGGTPQPWPGDIAQTAIARGARVELALIHAGKIASGAASGWLKMLPAVLHHQLVEPADFARLARLLMRRGVGLVLSGGGARGFAHLGIVRALREAGIPIDFVGGASLGAIIAAGVAMGWSDEEMRLRYRRSFVETNPVNDYTVPFLALTRGKKVTRLLEREYGAVLIEDLRIPFFCVSANLTTGLLYEHREGRVSHALRAAVAIPGVMPPVFTDQGVLVDGAAINNLPVECDAEPCAGLRHRLRCRRRSAFRRTPCQHFSGSDARRDGEQHGERAHSTGTCRCVAEAAPHPHRSAQLAGIRRRHRGRLSICARRPRGNARNTANHRRACAGRGQLSGLGIGTTNRRYDCSGLASDRLLARLSTHSSSAGLYCAKFRRF